MKCYFEKNKQKQMKKKKNSFEQLDVLGVPPRPTD
jgi:hypothetical protein